MTRHEEVIENQKKIEADSKDAMLALAENTMPSNIDNYYRGMTACCLGVICDHLKSIDIALARICDALEKKDE